MRDVPNPNPVLERPCTGCGWLTAVAEPFRPTTTMPDLKTIHGFYRYTDIWFEWYGWRLWSEFTLERVLTLSGLDCRNQVLPNKEDGFAVKAILAHDSITHPDHPLRIAGKQGIELFIGEARHIYCYYLPAQLPILSFQVPWKIAKRASCSLLRKSNTYATGCTQCASQKS